MITITIFYLLVLYCIILEMGVLQNPAKAIEISLSIKENTEWPNMTKQQHTYLINQSIYVFVVIIGLFSNKQWPIFLIIIIMSSLIFNGFRNKPIIRFVDALICSLLLLFSFINHFHLHIDLSHLITKFI